MKKKSAFLQLARLAVTLFLITAVMAVLLAGVNAVTRDKIAAAKAAKLQAALATVMPDAAGMEEISFTSSDSTIRSVYAATDGSGYAVEVAPAGFGGEITMLVGVGNDGKVTGISVISHAETAGLGAIAAAKTAAGEAFRQQFVGAEGSLAVTKDGGTIDAIASATITSRAVTDGVNAVLNFVKTLG